MVETSRDGTVGAGYDYQWDVASFLLLSVAAKVQDRDPFLTEHFAWLGPCVEVHLEGHGSSGALEDLTFFGASGRKLHVQVKERTQAGARWKRSDKSIIEFLARAASANGSDIRFLLLSNVDGDGALRKLVQSPESLAKYRNEIVVKRLREAAAVPEADKFAQLADTVKLVPYHEPRDPMKSRPTGIAACAVRTLFELGSSRAEHAWRDLYLKVVSWSIQSGGKHLTIAELCDEILAAVALSPTDLVSTPVVDVIEELHKPATVHTPGRVTWDDLTENRLFVSEDWVARAIDLLERTGVVVLFGARGAGKSTLVAQVVRRLHDGGDRPTLWDFEHRGRSLPCSAEDYLARTIAYGRLFGTRPVAVLENAHMAPDALQALIAAASHHTDLRLIITARNKAVLGNRDTQQRERLEGSVIDLSAQSDGAYGNRILDWYLTQVRHLDEEGRARSYAAVNWEDYVHDLVVLRLALESFDSSRFRLSQWAIYDHISGLIEEAVAEKAGAEAFLVLASGLGRSGVSTDLQAAARIFRISLDEIRSIAASLSMRGIVSVDSAASMSRFWHQSLAALYWETLHLNRGKWSHDTREVLGISA